MDYRAHSYLFLWLEIHTYIEEMKPILGERLMTCSYEQIFHQGLGLASITDFLKLERRGPGRITSTVDRWHANLEPSQEAWGLNLRVGRIVVKTGEARATRPI